MLPQEPTLNRHQASLTSRTRTTGSSAPTGPLQSSTLPAPRCGASHQHATLPPRAATTAGDAAAQRGTARLCRRGACRGAGKPSHACSFSCKLHSLCEARGARVRRASCREPAECAHASPAALVHALPLACIPRTPGHLATPGWPCSGGCLLQVHVDTSTPTHVDNGMLSAPAAVGGRLQCREGVCR